ncbi:hypothetical protein ASF88_02755 [Leifsonia sp. Leaf336]|uniref:PulJ/GspJ family protein n=1 Tax=Leifsonia sp. Leaf336 TaxID=1736341 RepID=UPI0007013009|nr:prepilin-type N-terminal cleavage/methylation domain-containing protein [Leifsonia sp. Leaf336]KQR53789.1 hypothetical protein ASF88_02755 [Leifsonia sp. Leaf336]
MSTSTERTQPRDAGITLAEVLVAMMIFGIMLTIVGAVFVSTNRNFAISRSLDTNTKSASNGMNEVSRVLRAATENPVRGQALNDPAFQSIGPETLTVYAYVNLSSSAEQPIQVRFSVDASRNLVEEVWPGTAQTGGYWTFPNPTSVAATTKRILASSIIPSSGSVAPLFSYLGVTNTPLSNPATNPRSIAAVQVSITAGTTTAGDMSNVTIQNTVGLPNLPLARS